MSLLLRTRKAVFSSLVLAAFVAGMAPTQVAATSSTNWTQQAPTQSPVGRAYAAMDYDSKRGRTVLFGGGNGPSSSQTLSDTWEWDGTTWTQRFPATSPPALVGPTMVYDSNRGLSVLFGGSTPSGASQATWEWDGTNWSQKSTAVSPPGGAWIATAFDAARGRTVLFTTNQSGGAETWTYDGTGWTKMSPTSSPSARIGSAMAYDAVHAVVVLFGGRASGTRMNDTWQWDGNNWTQMFPAVVPFARFWHSMAFDATLGRTVMFGGDHVEPYKLGSINDSWTWDGTNWTQIFPATSPSPRAGQAMAYESATGRAILFGGTDEGYPTETLYNDTWALASPDSDLALVATPADITVNATGASGATVMFTAPTASDEDPTAPGVICDHTSGSTFAVGVTTVTCQTSDADDTPSTVAATFKVTVLDTDLALTPAPADITAVATSASGARVTYQPPTASDEDGGSPAVTCDHASGSAFAVGTTIVTCQATDSDDTPSTAAETFRVTVLVDLRLALTVSPSTAGPGTSVTTSTSLRSLAAVDRTVTFAYVVIFTDTSGQTSTEASGTNAISLAAGQTVSTAFSFAVKKHTTAGTYTVSVSATDITGSVSANGSVTVT